ncbi:MAG TPA: RodZ domain-containing protein [Thermodesulfovibrionales bacterium]|nr:RodZ domain-containing protein [Thermodesulfovibrionales bacterium]
MIGNTLKQKREAQGLDLREVADTLKIRYNCLKDLEDTTTDKLPDDLYARGYLRQYAKLLGVDLESLIESYAAQQTAQDTPPDSPASQPKTGSRVSKNIVVIFSVVVIGAALFAVFSTLTGRREDKPLPPQVHQAERVTLEAPAPTPAPPALDQGSAVPREKVQGYTLHVRADETTWLRVDMGEGKSEEALLKPGEEKEWTSQDGFDLRVGNAGGIRLVLNGKEIEPLGKKGEVVRIKLPKEEFAAGAAAR